MGTNPRISTDVHWRRSVPSRYKGLSRRGDTDLGKEAPRIPAGYWHVEVKNPKPWIQADDVELFPVSRSIGNGGKEIEQPMPGELPVKARRNHGAIPIGFKSVVYDLFNFVKGRSLNILLFEGVPNNLQNNLTSAGSFAAVLQAKGNNAESNKLWVTVQWDGEKKPSQLSETSIRVKQFTLHLQSTTNIDFASSFCARTTLTGIVPVRRSIERRSSESTAVLRSKKSVASATSAPPDLVILHPYASEASSNS